MKKVVKNCILAILIVILLLSVAACSGSSKIKKGYKYVEKHMKNTILDFKVMEGIGGGAKITEAKGVYLEDDDYVYYYVTLTAYNQYGGYSGSDQYYYQYNINSNEVTESSGGEFWLLHGQYELQEKGMGNSDKKYYESKLVG